MNLRLEVYSDFFRVEGADFEALAVSKIILKAATISRAVAKEQSEKRRD
jgi:hypothetical protein